MRLRASQHIVSIIVLLVFLLTGQASVQGYVLCVAADGCAALEYSDNNSCDPQNLQETDSHAETHGLNTSASDDHCGPCFDIPAINEISSSRTQIKKDFSSPAGLPVKKQILSTLVSARLQNIPAPAQRLPSVSQTILAHRTVVLLN